MCTYILPTLCYRAHDPVRLWAMLAAIDVKAWCGRNQKETRVWNFHIWLPVSMSREVPRNFLKSIKNVDSNFQSLPSTWLIYILKQTVLSILKAKEDCRAACEWVNDTPADLNRIRSLHYYSLLRIVSNVPARPGHHFIAAKTNWNLYITISLALIALLF